MTDTYEHDFVSLGGVWLDELRWPNKEPQKDIVGGSATFATLGARLFSTSPSKMCLVVQAGNDFPQHILEQLRSWKIELQVRPHRDMPSTRGILDHTAGTGYAHFTRLTPPLLSYPDDLAQLGLLSTAFVHLFESPEMAQAHAQRLDMLRESANPPHPQPLIIWEPHPKSCTPELRPEHLAVLNRSSIAAFSPNHFELGALWNKSRDLPFDRKTVEQQASAIWLHSNMPEFNGSLLQALVIRAAEHGCLIMERRALRLLWLPAYWSSMEQDQVIDPTGAGNAFLGGLAQGYLETKCWIKAACYGAVAAGIVVQHIGVPPLSHSEDSELWGAASVRSRLRIYMSRPEVEAALQYAA